MSTAAKRLKKMDTEDALAYEITSPATLHVLGEEMAKAHRWRKVPELTADGNLATASPDLPVVLYVHRTDADDPKVALAVKRHTPETEEPSWMAKARGDEDLDPTEIQQALRFLLAGRL